MTPTTTAGPLSGFVELAGTRQFTVDEYHQLIEAGILGPDDKVELLDGYIVYKADYPDLLPTATAFPQWRWLRRFTSAEYHTMLGSGVLGRGEKLELLDGYVVLKMSQQPPHRFALNRFIYRVPPVLPAGWLVMPNCPISLGVMDPEPDGVIVRGADSDYRDRAPVATDFGIVAEVSDSTLKLDRAGKGRLYARAGVPVFWIINVADNQIEVYTDPDSEEYKVRTDYRPGDAVPIVLDGAIVGTIPAADLLP